MDVLRTAIVIGFAALLSACSAGTRSLTPELPALPLQAPHQATQAPVVSVGGRLHVGADVAPPAGALPVAAHHGEVRVSHGSVRDGVGKEELIAYLLADAASYADPEEEPGTDPQLLPGGLITRFAAMPPTVRVAAGTPPELLDETVRVVQAINAALPRDWQLGFGDVRTPADFPAPGDGEILVTFGRQADLPPEVVPPMGEDIGLAEPRYSIVPTGDPAMPWTIEIVGGRIRVDPSQTSGLERLGVIAHELIHLLGRGHVDPERFPETLMVAGGSEELSVHVLHPLDREALLAVYGRTAPGIPLGRFPDALGPWSETSMHVHGAIDGEDGEISFGAALRNGLSQPWAEGPTPNAHLEDNASLSGSVRWTGRVVGLTPRSETVSGVAKLVVDVATLLGSVDFTDLEHWEVGVAPGGVGTGSVWLDGDLSYRIEVLGNTFIQTGGDEGSVTGAFFDPDHEGMGGVVVRDDLSAGFGGRR